MNINYGHNTALVEKCKSLEEYAKFVEVSKQFVTNANDRKEALNDAIEYCMKNHILEKSLRKYRQEVLGMLLEKFDVEKYERTLREEGREEGIHAFINACDNLNIPRKQIINSLMAELSLSQEAAESYYHEYSKMLASESHLP